jgi:hypothetical protein
MHQHLLMTRPETHQNLINTDKDQHDRRHHQPDFALTGGDRSNGVTTHRGRHAQTRDRAELETSAILQPWSGHQSGQETSL